MEWTQISLSVAADQIERAAGIAHMCAADEQGLYIEDYSDLEQGALEIAHMTLIDEELLAKDRVHALIHLYLPQHENPAEAVSFLRERLGAENISHTVSTAAVNEEDWANNWKQYFKPMPAGEHLLICPNWEQPPAGNTRTVLRIDPGMAFGTGSHATTRLMLAALERVIRPGRGQKLLDAGCGSGILSVAGLLLGAESALGVDIDRTAVRVAVENGAANGFSSSTKNIFQAPRYRILHGNLTSPDFTAGLQGTFDIVAANIVADALILLTPAIRKLLNPDGIYLLSGIIGGREAEVTDCLAENGFTVVERTDESDWVCLGARAQ
ncbi:MAG: 50S ribosomal protein L11 methyltransferase [Oscillospiraceae bacterium]|nr:50S ribosomal protein L11 methyltransferase [Oscillospiraceae bacterium]